MAVPRERRGYPSTGSTLGLLQTALPPNLTFHGALSLLTYAAARATDRVELKDWLWPSGMVLNTWAAFLARKSIETPDSSVVDAFVGLPWPHKLLLTGVTAWGGRLFYRIVTRSIRRRQRQRHLHDDPRYVAVKRESADDGFWTKALFSMFLPEAIFQSFITLPFTLPFRFDADAVVPDGRARGVGLAHYHHHHDIGPDPEQAEWFRALAVGLFCSGFALEVLADRQLDKHKDDGDNDNDEGSGSAGLVRSGVWSIVRHPNYLGDALIHLSFPSLLLSSSATNYIHPLLTFLGPVANYVFLRHVGGDRQTEAYQKDQYNVAAQRGSTEAAVKLSDFEHYKTRQNSFWPKPDQVKNKWTWIVVGIGAVAAVVERGIRGGQLPTTA
ncbi:hypothetical protein PV08_11414 [Exophiala spinifera]|uniref:Steroid 5-alpha reductase C-terminal domain-containing protein n=1 Tax=Exophiala spinifera TaxID=91928 RepID=A0A0D2AVI6_9EURO|nr:uncharacterized protein PV08_11414 [Exophiala spinifera]KIW10450.1 hypothetical protein PV08_11414 [Exophiala spinifera]